MVRPIHLGARFWKSLVGETMFAAVLVDSVAMMISAMASATHIGLCMWPIRLTGSETVSPTSVWEAAVSTTPRAANRNMVSGRPRICPRIWSFWLLA
ncbi:hypothetical protein D3C77_403410 [compost metagenome]